MTSYAVYPFTESMRAVPQGNRLVVVRWKNGKNEDGTVRVAHTPVCVVVPLMAIKVAPQELGELVQEAFEVAQDGIIREYIEGELERDWNLVACSIPASLLTTEAVAKWHAQNASDNRGAGKLSKEGIANWFGGSLYEVLAEKFMEKLIFSEQNLDDAAIASKVEGAIGRYRDMFCKLAAPKVALPGSVLEQLDKAIELMAEKDAMAIRLQGVINKAKTPVHTDLMDML